MHRHTNTNAHTTQTMEAFNLNQILAQYNSAEARAAEKKAADEKKRKKENPKDVDAGGNKPVKSKLKVLW